jgi:hypothetical protein
MTTTTKPFDSIEYFHSKKTKSHIIDWLVNRFKVEPFAHSYWTQFIRYDIWNGWLSISLDFRNEDHHRLFDAIPAEYKGVDQVKTGKRVNLNTLYFNLDKEYEIPYPKIVRSKIIKEVRHKDDDCVGCYFYVYTFEVFLSDNTSFITTGQSTKLDVGESIFRTKMQERYFYNHVLNLNL